MDDVNILLHCVVVCINVEIYKGGCGTYKTFIKPYILLNLIYY